MRGQFVKLIFAEVSLYNISGLSDEGAFGKLI